MVPASPDLRYSGHESFVLRVGWLRKYYDAATLRPEVLESDEAAITGLGIGRNMVKSLEFWAGATDIVQRSGKALAPGALGTLLFHPENGIDLFMESADAVALVHWGLVANANLAAWELVFGHKSLNRFTKRQLIERLTARATSLKRALSPLTIEQHVSILLASYTPPLSSEEQSADGAPCPLHDLELIRLIQTASKDELFEVRSQDRLQLQPQTFGRILAQYWAAAHPGAESIPFDSVLNGHKSPGTAFRLTAYALENAVARLEEKTNGAFRLLDTADTRRIGIQSSTALKNWAAL